MKWIAALTLACWTVTSAFAADSQWTTDVPAAQKKAKDEKKLLLLDFTGSDWCPPCMALHKNVFTSKEFLDYAKGNLVLVELDFPEGKKQSKELADANQALAKQMKIEGFPTVIILDGEGKELNRTTGYDGKGPKDFIARIEKLRKK